MQMIGMNVGTIYIFSVPFSLLSFVPGSLEGGSLEDEEDQGENGILDGVAAKALAWDRFECS